MHKLTQIPKWVKTTCPYCGTGCGVEAQVNQSGKTFTEHDLAELENYWQQVKIQEKKV